MKTKLVSSLFALTCAFALSGSTASAAPMGHLDVANCQSVPGGGVIVSALMIDWIQPVGGGTGCIATGTNTNISYVGGGPLGPGTTGTILDLVFGGPALVPNFMTFAGNPNLHFDLGLLGPGPSRTDCAALALFESCSVVAGSPFALQRTTTGTGVVLSASGIARDLLGSSTWAGAFTTQISNLTPAQIQSIILGGGSVQSTHSGDFVLTAIPVPEPLSMTLLGLGLIGTAARARRRQLK